MGTKSKNLELFPLKAFRKNVVMRTYEFVVDGLIDETFELLFVDAESLDVAQTKAKEKAEELGYPHEPQFVRIFEPKLVEKK